MRSRWGELSGIPAHSERQAGCSDCTILITTQGSMVIAPSLTALLLGCFLPGGVSLSFLIWDYIVLDASVS